MGKSNASQYANFGWLHQYQTPSFHETYNPKEHTKKNKKVYSKQGVHLFLFFFREINPYLILNKI